MLRLMKGPVRMVEILVRIKRGSYYSVKPWFVFLIAFFLVIVFSTFFQWKKDNHLDVFLTELPTSNDPWTYDFVKHHAIQSLLNIKLVSSYKNSSLSPALASRWSVNDAQDRWEFFIRNDVKFKNGNPVSPEAVRLSLTRIFFLLKKSGSKNEFLQHLKGFDLLHSPSSNIKGLEALENSVVFQFNKPIKNLLEQLSFGVFAIVSPDTFDPSSGDWISDFNSNYPASGPYEIKSMGLQKIVFKARPGYPADLKSPTAFTEIVFSSNPADRKSADIFRAATGPSENPEDYGYFNSGPDQILYFYAHSWNLPGGPLQDINLRRSMRDEMQKRFREVSTQATLSFFSPLTPGFENIKPNNKNHEWQKNKKFEGNEITFYDVRPAMANISNQALNALDGAISSFGFTPKGILGVKAEALFDNKNPKRKKYDLDIGYYSTGLAIDDPVADLRLMFSPEGIWLADATGEIQKELAHNQPSLSRINQALYDQAIVWPIAHYSQGIWAKKNLDMSQYNTQLPLGELQWIGQKGIL